MKGMYLDQLRRLIREISPSGERGEIVKKMAFVSGGMRALEPYLGTVCLGCTSRDAIPMFYSLVTSIRRLGCPLLLREAERLEPESLPGEAWVMFACTEEKARVLQQTLSRVKGCEMYEISHEVYMLACQRVSDAVSLSVEVEELVERRYHGKGPRRPSP